MSALSLNTVSRIWRTLVLTSILGAILALALSFVQPLQYSATVRLLITEPTSGTTDPYTALKFTERIADSLSELLYSSSFANNIIHNAQGLDLSYFPQNEYNKRKVWQKTIETAVSPGTGIMTVAAYHPSRDQARILVEAASHELSIQAPNYFGPNVRVQVIDTPLDSRWYAKPDFARNVFLGFGVGLFLGLAWLLVGPRRVSRLS